LSQESRPTEPSDPVRAEVQIDQLEEAGISVSGARETCTATNEVVQWLDDLGIGVAAEEPSSGVAAEEPSSANSADKTNRAA
jgi:hypothetical protein